MLCCLAPIIKMAGFIWIWVSSRFHNLQGSRRSRPRPRRRFLLGLSLRPGNIRSCHFHLACAHRHPQYQSMPLLENMHHLLQRPLSKYSNEQELGYAPLSPVIMSLSHDDKLVAIVESCSFCRLFLPRRHGLLRSMTSLYWRHKLQQHAKPDPALDRPSIRRWIPKTLFYRMQCLMSHETPWRALPLCYHHHLMSEVLLTVSLGLQNGWQKRLSGMNGQEMKERRRIY